MYFPATVWNRAKIAAKGFEPAYEIVLDWWLQLELLLDGEQALLDPEITFEYRRHPLQMSTTTAFDVTRFHEERALSLRMRAIARARGWKRAARASTVQESSRLHALMIVAKLLRARRLGGSGALLAHAFTNRKPPGDWPS